MKKILLFLLLLLIATSCATRKTITSRVKNVPVYYTGDDAPAASSGMISYSGKQ